MTTPPTMSSAPASGSGIATLRRTRFVCISDTHNHTAKLPKGDVLVHAGDLTNQGSYSELSRAVEWLEKADFEAKIVVAGNHDITLDEDFYAQHGRAFHGQSPESPTECLGLLTRPGSSLTYLCHSSTTIRLSSPSGPHTCFSIFGSPYSPHHTHGSRPRWAFGYSPSSSSSPPTIARSPPAELPGLWDAIPLDVDVVVTHTPPRLHCDEARDRGPSGCEALRRALWRVRPRLAVCGHVHEGRGAERVRWVLGGHHGNDDHDDESMCPEESVEQWVDPGSGSAKLSLVDLTGRKGGKALDNDGGGSTRIPFSHGDGVHSVVAQRSTRAAGPAVDPHDPDARMPESDDAARSGCGMQGSSSSSGDRQELENDDTACMPSRRETCIVNCAIAATNYPHAGGRRYNKPIVVDLDLPVWGGGDDHRV